MAKHGASGQAYVARTKKRVYLWIGPSGTNSVGPAMKRKYIFVAGDLSSDERWNGSDEVTIQFYDFGDGVVASEARRRGTPSNHVATVRFARDARSGGFIEVK